MLLLTWPNLTLAQEGAPATPTALSPGSASEPGPVIDTLTPTLKWTPVSGADYYIVFVRDHPSGNIAFNPTQVVDPWVTLPAGTLKPGWKYRWYVQAYGSGGKSAFSNTLYFQTRPPSISLKVICTGSGSVSPQGCNTTQSYVQNTSLTLTAKAEPGWQFLGWTGACLGTGVCQPTTDYDKSVVANFFPAPLPTPIPPAIPTPLAQPGTTPQPASSPTSTPQSIDYMPLFADDFESGQALSWAQRGTATGEWKVAEKDGNRFLSLTGLVTLSTGGGVTWTDYFLRVRVVLLEGEATINFRQQGAGPSGGPPTDWYSLRMSRYDLLLGKNHRIPDAQPQFTLLASAPGDFKPGPWYSISIELEGNQIAVSVDGVPKLKYVDAQEALLRGGFNLASGSLATSHVLFDDVWAGRVKAPQPTPTPQPPAQPAPTPQAQATTQLTPAPAAPAAPPGDTGGIFSLEMIATVLAIVTGVGGIAGWLITRRVAGGKKRRLQKLLNEIDTVYTRFKMNTRRCEAELYRLRDILVEELKEGKIEEQTYSLLEKRLDSYLEEIRERIIDEKLGGFPGKLKDSLARMRTEGTISDEEFNSIEKLLIATTELSDEDKEELRNSLSRWRGSYAKKDQPDKR